VHNFRTSDRKILVDIPSSTTFNERRFDILQNIATYTRFCFSQSVEYNFVLDYTASRDI